MMTEELPRSRNVSRSADGSGSQASLPFGSRAGIGGAKILVLFASSYGQTEKVARQLAARWRAMGHEVEVHPVTRAAPAPRGFDAVVIGSRLAVNYARSVRTYVETHRDALAAVQSGFFSVSMSEASSDPAAHATVHALIRHFLEATGWIPKHVASFAGALQYTKYDPVTRLIMKLISARTGQTTDTSRDHEFTDWAQVDGFANSVAAALQSTPGEQRSRAQAAS